MSKHYPTIILLTAVALFLALIAVAFAPQANAKPSKPGSYSGAGAGVARLGPIEVGEFRVDTFDQWAVELIPYGYRWANGFALESFADYERHAIEGDGEFPPFPGRSVTVGLLRLGACGVYRYDSILTIDPYVRACFGGAYAGLDPNGYDALVNEDGWNFQSGDIGWGWKVGAGGEAALTDDDRVRVRVGYSYGGYDGISFTGGREHNDALRSHRIMATFLVAH